MASGDSNFTNLIASGSVVASGNMTVTGSVTGGSAVFSGVNKTGTWLRLTAQTAQLTGAYTAGTLTPTGTYQPVSPGTSGAELGTIAVITMGQAGDMLYLVNTGAGTVVFTDGTALQLSGTTTLKQYETLTMVCDGNRWIEIGQGANAT